MLTRRFKKWLSIAAITLILLPLIIVFILHEYDVVPETWLIYSFNSSATLFALYWAVPLLLNGKEIGLGSPGNAMIIQRAKQPVLYWFVVITASAIMLVMIGALWYFALKHALSAVS